LQLVFILNQRQFVFSECFELIIELFLIQQLVKFFLILVFEFE
jgi:hypothetical protein